MKSRTVVHACGAASAVAWAILALRSRETAAVPLDVFFACLALSWTALGLAWAATRSGAQLRLRSLLLWALVFRAIGLAAEPVLEDDPYRYLWDGRSSVVHGNPYAGPPTAGFSDSTLTPRFEVILDRINNPDVPTIYAPGAQAVFALGYLVAPGELWPLKLLVVLADLAILALLLRWLRPEQALLYAWCPLLIQETAFNAHFDALALALAMLALAGYRERRDWLVPLALAGAVAVKPVALVLAPLLLPALGWRGTVRFAATALLLHAPLLMLEGGASPGLARFAGGWEFNSTGHALLALAFGDAPARIVALALFGLGLGTLGLRGMRALVDADAPRATPRGDVAFGLLFLLSPVTNPWYLLWMLPFVALRPTRWGIAALAVVSLSYAHGLFLPDSGLPPYHHPLWLRPLEVGVVAIALLADALRPRLDRPPEPGPRPDPGRPGPGRDERVPDTYSLSPQS